MNKRKVTRLFVELSYVSRAARCDQRHSMVVLKRDGASVRLSLSYAFDLFSLCLAHNSCDKRRTLFRLVKCHTIG